MSTIMPQGELLKKAVAFIADEHKESGRPIMDIIQDAGCRFNLGPKDEEALTRFFKDNPVED